MSSRTLVSACLFIVTLASPAMAGYGWWGTRAPNTSYVSAIRQGTHRLVSEGGRTQESSDGRTWRDVPSPDGRSVAVTALSGDILYVATTGGVYRQLGPTAWRRSQQGLPAPLSMYELAVDSAGTLAALVEPVRSGPEPEPLTVFRSLDEGLTWVQTLTRFAENPRLIVAGRATGEFLVATFTHLYRSTDGGLTFNELTRPVTDGSGTTITAIHVHPRVASLVFVGTTEALLRSSDGGLAWEIVVTGPFGPQVFDVATAPMASGPMFAVYGSRLLSSDDLGVSWSPVSGLPSLRPRALGFIHGAGTTAPLLTVGGNGLAVAPLSTLSGWSSVGLTATTFVTGVWTTRTGVVVADGGSIWTSHDRARTWTRRGVRTPSGAERSLNALAVDRTSSDRLFAGTDQSDEGVVFGSVDGGRTWQRRDAGLPDDHIVHVAIDPRDANRLFASSASGLYRSTDGGANWNLAASSASVGTVQDIVFGPAQGTMYASGSSLHRSDDGGESWAQLPLTSTAYFMGVAVDPARPDVVYAAYSKDIYRTDGTVERSIDGGRTWTRVTDGLPAVGLSIRGIVLHDSVPYLVAGAVYRLGSEDRWERVRDLPVANQVFAIAFDDDDRSRLYVGTDRGLFAEALRGDETVDTDGDGLPDVWETRYQLDLLDPTDAATDVDGDGRTARDGYRSAVDFRHPRGFHRAAFAEGIANAEFQTRYAIANVGNEVAAVVARFVLDSGRVVQRELEVRANERLFIEAESIPELVGRTFGVEFASDRFLAVDRRVRWAHGAGAHREIGQVASRDWYFAEGATHSAFNVFYAVSNQSDEPVELFLRPLVLIAANTTGDPLDIIWPARVPFVVPARSRMTIWLNQVLGMTYPAQDIGAHISASDPVVVERVMYLASADSPFGAGHASAGARAPSTRWTLAEGATGSFFDAFVLMANPFAVPSTARLTYRRQDGVTATKAYVVPPFGRVTVWVDEEVPDERGALFRDAAVSIEVDASQPIVVERSMWWPGPTVSTWAEAHVSPGVDGHGQWLIPDAEVGGASNAETYVLVANVSSMPTSVVVGMQTSDPVEFRGTAVRRFSLAPGERVSVPVGDWFSDSIALRGITSAVISVDASLPTELPGSVVVERSTYSDAGGQRWRAGSSAPGIPLP